MDDELPALDELVFLLQADDRVASVDVAHDATGALHMLRDHNYDLLMLDVRMPHLDGLELARLLLRFSEPPSVVFVTAYDEHAARGLRGPRQRLPAEAAVRRPARRGPRAGVPEPDRRRARRRTTCSIVPVDIGGTTRMIDRSDITWVEAQGDYVRLHVVSGPAIWSGCRSRPLAERWAELGFVRIHRGYLVAIRHITELSSEGGTSIVRIGADRTPGLPAAHQGAARPAGAGGASGWPAMSLSRPGRAVSVVQAPSSGSGRTRHRSPTSRTCTPATRTATSSSPA